MTDWMPDWSGQCAAVVASGPSVKQEDVDKLHDRMHVVAINESWRLAPWADLVYGCEPIWWKQNKYLPEYNGIKVAMYDRMDRMPDNFHCVTLARDAKNEFIHQILMEPKGTIGCGSNSGFQSLNLVAQCGVKAIVMLGFDMRETGQAHWHGRHKHPLRNPCEAIFTQWRKHLDGAAKTFNSLGIEVVNCSAVSALEAYPKMSVDEVMQRWKL